MSAPPSFDDPAMKDRFEVLYWFLHRSKEKTRPLKNGEKFNLAYTFTDPKGYAKLNLVFGDVPPFLWRSRRTRRNESSAGLKRRDEGGG